MQPYQKAEETLRTSGEYPINLAKNIGLSVVGGGAAKIGAMGTAFLIPKIASLINPLVPDKFSKKGLENLVSGFKTFINGAEKEGFDYNEIRDFIGDKIEKTKKVAQGNRNIIEQYSPELHQFLSEQIKNGRKPIAAGAIAEKDKRFADIIKKIKKDHKLPWGHIIDTVYGLGTVPQPVSSQEPIQAPPMQTQQSNGEQGGPGQNALMGILQQINQRRGGQ